eukprot:scaffold13941_cov105-Skeletonema_marinoi.AAC.2
MNVISPHIAQRSDSVGGYHIGVQKQNDEGMDGGKIRSAKSFSETGNRTPVSRVTGGDTSHYTISDLMIL